MKARYYFSDHNEDKCYTLKSMYRWMEDEGMTELVIYPAVMMTGEDFYYCNFFGEAGEVGGGCGKQCSEYKPRNGKNGRCSHSQNCYEPNLKQPITITKFKQEEK